LIPARLPLWFGGGSQNRAVLRTTAKPNAAQPIGIRRIQAVKSSATPAQNHGKLAQSTSVGKNCECRADSQAAKNQVGAGSGF